MYRALAVTVVLLACGCGQTSQSLDALEDPRNSQQADSVNRFTESWEQAGEIELYEGLPHEGLDRQLFEAELASKSVVRFGSYPFYAESLSLTDADVTRLGSLLLKVSSFRPRQLDAAKSCGGFHPDYCVVWQFESVTFYSLLCFGCNEAVVAGGGYRYYADLTSDASSELQHLLLPYRTNRPPRQTP